MRFLPDAKRLLNLTKISGQRMLFSAILDKDMDSLVKTYLKNPITRSLANEKSTVGNITHHVLIMVQSHMDLITSQISARKCKSIFYTRTKHGADKLTKSMNEAGVAVGALHGGKT
jgi:superfamily II DNA/RNA helicase